jgi:hypothetical protein
MTYAIKLHKSECLAIDSDSSGDEDVAINVFAQITGAEPGGDNSTYCGCQLSLEIFPRVFSVNFKFGTSSAATALPVSMLTVKRPM